MLTRLVKHCALLRNVWQVLLLTVTLCFNGTLMLT